MKAKKSSLLKTNLKSIILFEIIYKIFSVLFLGTIGIIAFRLCLLASGINYLAGDTGGQFFLNPITWLLIIIYLLFLVFVTMAEILGVLTAIHESAEQRKMSVTQIFQSGFTLAKQSLKLKNTPLFVFVLLILPFAQVIPLAGIVDSIQIPGFIMDYIMANKVLTILVAAVFVILTIVSVKKLFSIPAFALRGGDYKEASAFGNKIIKGRFIRTLFGLIAFSILCGLIALVIIAVLSAIAMFFIAVVVAEPNRHDVVLNVVPGISVVVFSIYTLVAPVLSFANIYKMYCNSCIAHNVKPADKVIKYKPLEQINKTVSYLALAGLIILATISILLDPSILETKDISSVVVSAHRGASADTPENSIAAFEKAIELHADEIELDVHQTKDGVVVVTHDDNIQRIAGVDKYVYDLTLEELKSYDVGSWFDSKFSYLRVATLEEVLQLCQGKIDLQIELKPTGNEPDFEQHVVDLIRKYNFEDHAVLGSLQAEPLKKVKEIAPDIKTLYIMFSASGDVYKTEFADVFSIEETNVDADMIRDIHNAGKKCYVWTINSDENVDYLLGASIDGIVTDDPVLIQKALLRGGKNPLLVSIVDAIYGVDTYAPLYSEDPFNTP